MTNYNPVIGLEIHVELNTITKMFCGCSTKFFGAEPNSHTCPVCLGLPGALPFINEEAIKKCIQIGLSLNCKVQQHSLFERKNYFYPDLPKGYQISQYRWPLCVDGSIEVTGQDGQSHTIRINRVHQEEDTGKLMHAGPDTVIDFNRSGVPLVEVVTEPDFQDTTQVKEYAKKIQEVLRSLGVSNADMEKGEMRLEANISVRPEGQTELPNYRVELKNINSFRFMAEAIEYEIKRQAEALEKGETLTQQTRGWNESKKETFIQREKEEANDYRYFPDPDLPELRLTEEYIESIKSQMPKSSQIITKELALKYNIADATSEALVKKGVLSLYEEILELDASLDSKRVANYLINTALLGTASEIVKKLQLQTSGVVEDESELEKFAKEAMIEDPSAVQNYKNGKLGAIQALVGAIMRKTQGKANPAKTREILEKLLN